MAKIAGIAAENLRSFVQRIEAIEKNVREEQEARKEIYAEAKCQGFDVAIIRQIVKERRADPDDLDEQRTLLDLYRAALREWESTPLARAAE